MMGLTYDMDSDCYYCDVTWEAYYSYMFKFLVQLNHRIIEYVSNKHYWCHITAYIDIGTLNVHEENYCSWFVNHVLTENALIMSYCLIDCALKCLHGLSTILYIFFTLSKILKKYVIKSLNNCLGTYAGYLNDVGSLFLQYNCYREFNNI